MNVTVLKVDRIINYLGNQKWKLHSKVYIYWKIIYYSQNIIDGYSFFSHEQDQPNHFRTSSQILNLGDLTILFWILLTGALRAIVKDH